MHRKLKNSMWTQSACTTNWLSKDTQSTEIWIKWTKSASNMCCGFVLRTHFFCQQFTYFSFDFALTSTIIQSSFQFFRAQFDLRLSIQTLYQWLWMNNHACMQYLSWAFMCMVSYTIVWLLRKYQCRIEFAYRLFNACLNTTHENNNALVMNCCNVETSEVVAVIMNVSTSFTAKILIYRQGDFSQTKILSTRIFSYHCLQTENHLGTLSFHSENIFQWREKFPFILTIPAIVLSFRTFFMYARASWRSPTLKWYHSE